MKRRERSLGLSKSKQGKRKKDSLEKPTQHREQENEFEKFMKKVGFIFKENGNKMKTNSTVVQQKLLGLLSQQHSIAEMKKIILNAMSDSFEKEQFFVHCLLPTELVTSDEGLEMDSSQFSNNIQDSLVKVLLRCEDLQSVVIEVLLQKFPVYTDNENVQVKSLIHQGNAQSIVNIPRLILNQLRWVNVIHNPASVANHLIEMASLMGSSTACDIICFLPDLLVADNDHTTIATSLCDLLNTGPENITAAVFEALSNLVLTGPVANNVHEIALSHLSTAELKDIPIIIKYLLKSCSGVDSTKEVISSLRPNIDFSVLTQSSSSQDVNVVTSNTTLIADALFSSMNFHFNVFTAWIAVLEKVDKKQLNIGDVVCLILLCDVQSTNHKKTALALLHNKIKTEQISKKLFTTTFKTCPHILAAHFKPLCKITQGMIWNSHPLMARTGALIYKLCLLHMEAYYKQEALGYIIEHISASSSTANKSEADTALEVLQGVAEVQVDILLPYANYISDALTSMDIMNLSQIRKSYRVLCLLAFADCTDAFISGMRNEMHMMIRKQLTNISDRFQHVGIIGCLTSLVAMSSANKSNDPTQNSNILSLFDTLKYVLHNQLHGWSLFYDEICFASKNNSKFSKYLVKLLNENAQEKLEKLFLTDCAQATPSSSSLETSYRFSLVPDGTEASVALKLLPVGSRINDLSLMLCPLFRAIASLEKMATGLIENIDAMQVCPLLMYSSKFEEKSVFKSFEEKEKTQILDCLFFAANWIREVLSIFSSELGEDVEITNLKRLKHVCDIQTTLEQLLPHAPTVYNPPCFNSNAKSQSKFQGKSGKGQTSKTQSSLKSQKTHNATMDPAVSPTLEKSQKSMKKKGTVVPTSKVTLSSQYYRPHLKELNKEVLCLLKYPLHFRKSEEQESVPDMEKYLEPQNLLFLLSDLNFKLQHRLAKEKLPFGFGVQAASISGMDRLNEEPISSIAGFAVKLIPHLFKHLNGVASYFKEVNTSSKLSQLSDDSISSAHSGENLIQNEYLSRCYECLLEILSHIISYKDIDEGSGETLLDVILLQMASQLGRGNPEKYSLLKSFLYIKNFAEAIPTFASACTLVKVSSALLGFANAKKIEESKRCELSNSVSDTANSFLQRNWSDLNTANSQNDNKLLTFMFEQHLKHSPDVLESIETFLTHILPQLLDSPREPDSDDSETTTYACINKANFHLFYKGMMEAVTSHTSRITSPSNRSNTDVDTVDMLLQWREVIKVLDLLIRVLKSFPMRVMLSPALKQGRMIVESFIKSGVPLCEVMFKLHQDEIINLLKNIQQVTRQLQNAACHAKISKDTSLTNHVPALRRTLETFIFKVKGIFVLHNCHEAFWLGNLKNRNLKGEVILTQASPVTSEDDIDDDCDVTISHPVQTEESYSESY